MVYEKLHMFILQTRRRYSHILVGITLVLISLLTFFRLVEDWLPTGYWKYDTIAINYVYGIRNGTLNGVFRAITSTGNTVSVIIITLIITIYLIYKEMKSQRIAFALNVLGVWIFNEILKAIFKRPRPSGVWLVKATGYSFPSGHAMISMGLSLLAIYFILSYIKKRRTAVTIAIAILAYAILIGLSRVYVGVHYLSDVLAGWMAGLLWVTLFVSVYGYLGFARKSHDSEVNEVILVNQQE